MGGTDTTETKTGFMSEDFGPREGFLYRPLLFNREAQTWTFLKLISDELTHLTEPLVDLRCPPGVLETAERTVVSYTVVHDLRCNTLVVVKVYLGPLNCSLK